MPLGIGRGQARDCRSSRRIGVDIPSVSHLDRHSARYRDALPILLKHLLMPHSSVTRAGIADVLAAPEPAVRKAWPILVAEYKKARSGVGMAAPGDTVASELTDKDALAWTLAVAVTDATLDELISLVASDPDLQKEIASWRPA